MEVCSGLGTVMVGSPLLCIDGFGGFEVESELRDDLPFEAEIRTAANAIRGGDRESIKDIVLVAIDAIIPFAGIEALEAEAKA